VSDKDTIYRQDAIDAINAYLGLSAVSRTIQNMTSIQEILENLPSAQQCMTATSNTMVSETVKIPVMDGTTERLPSAEPERKKGKWLLIDAGYYDYVKCSQCGETHVWGRNFCPNCGADMREGEEE